MAFVKLEGFDKLEVAPRTMWKQTGADCFSCSALDTEVMWYASTGYYVNSAKAYAVIDGIVETYTDAEGKIKQRSRTFSFTNNVGQEDVTWTPVTKTRKNGTTYECVVPSRNFEMKGIEVVCIRENEHVALGEIRAHLVLVP